MAFIYYLYIKKFPIVNQEKIELMPSLFAFLVPFITFGLIIFWYDTPQYDSFSGVARVIYTIVGGIMTLLFFSLTRGSLFKKMWNSANLLTILYSTILTFLILFFILSGSEYILMRIPIF
jgi:hypothetical protein